MRMCKDCGEIFTQGEFIQARKCARCGAELHLECAMANDDAEDLCEADWFRDELEFRQTMKALGGDLEGRKPTVKEDREADDEDQTMFEAQIEGK